MKQSANMPTIDLSGCPCCGGSCCDIWSDDLPLVISIDIPGGWVDNPEYDPEVGCDCEAFTGVVVDVTKAENANYPWEYYSEPCAECCIYDLYMLISCTDAGFEFSVQLNTLGDGAIVFTGTISQEEFALQGCCGDIVLTLVPPDETTFAECVPDADLTITISIPCPGSESLEFLDAEPFEFLDSDPFEFL